MTGGNTNVALRPAVLHRAGLDPVRLVPCLVTCLPVSDCLAVTLTMHAVQTVQLYSTTVQLYTLLHRTTTVSLCAKLEHSTGAEPWLSCCDNKHLPSAIEQCDSPC